MSIALTGASGNLGRLVVEELLSRGTPADQIVAIVRNPAKIADFAAHGVTVRRGDYADPASLRAALDGVDRLLLISVSGPGASSAHRNVIDAAVDAGVGHIAYTSILNADHTTNPLAPEHYATEGLLAASGIPVTILRNAWYHELYTRLMPGYLATGEVVGSTGEGRISGAARPDFAAAAATVLLCDELPEAGAPRIHELGGPSFTLAELAQTLSEVAGRSIAHRNLTDAEYTAELETSGAGASAGLVVRTDASIRAGEMHTESDDLARLVGRPLRPLAESLRLAL
ncbi:SDR family oxidoreductase [Propionibacterium australiense]|uniref:NAD(P)-binding domain n=1 Tax=Propionibacterium australiense TaxID=119981 RepID=A0A383S6E0_9ACTN|nr:SDR family oxidoreductase [Propionibacterium australiense]RLP09668.1 NAD-dependent epimerase/dehydratase family protein [Propionibacterium australiense]RLP12370.1 NAD-dependent epimerase/dehydratase family protein [Propionibacterium australiense]SYZ33575.1 NAD(P)-binding domain [Propionibacterium australiense]VEH89542.1 Quinone oxidoreductase 2 [Propionibacterium australiense]